MEWKSYGDVNPIEHGGIFIKPDTVAGCFNVVKLDCVDDSIEPFWVVGDLYVDLNDDWINWEGVQSFSGVGADDEDIEKVIAVVEYYNPQEFGTDTELNEREQVIQELAKYQIDVE